MAFYKNEIEVIRPTLAQGVGALFTERTGACLPALGEDPTGLWE